MNHISPILYQTVRDALDNQARTLVRLDVVKCACRGVPKEEQKTLIMDLRRAGRLDISEAEHLIQHLGLGKDV